jgi:hypothetical protein
MQELCRGGGPARRAARIRAMHPFVRNLVIGIVGLIIAGGLSAIAILGEDTGLSVASMLASGLIATAIGVFLFVQGWIWSQRAYRRGSPAMAVGIAIAGGLMIVLAGCALAASIVLVLLFNVL